MDSFLYLCIGNRKKVNMNKEINNNGYDYVDLGLPSGTLWATMNVGASKPSDFGLYFQWGDIQGYTTEQVGKGSGQKAFTFKDYKFNQSGNGKTFTKSTTTGDTLELEDDAAHVNMGGDWHTPTPTQIQELLDNTTTTWTTLDVVNGKLFTSKIDPSKFIFIPTAGGACNGSVPSSGECGCVWSSQSPAGYIGCGHYLIFYSGNAYLNFGNRCVGFSVRGVIG